MLKPFDISKNITPDLDLPDELTKVLIDHGLAAVKVDQNIPESKANIRDKFNNAGASIDEVAKQVSNIMMRGETDSGRLKAAELALKVHGILQELDEKPIPSITVNIHSETNKTLINLVLPTV